MPAGRRECQKLEGVPVEGESASIKEYQQVKKGLPLGSVSRYSTYKSVSR